MIKDPFVKILFTLSFMIVEILVISLFRQKNVRNNLEKVLMCVVLTSLVIAVIFDVWTW